MCGKVFVTEGFSYKSFLSFSLPDQKEEFRKF
jgi:hypothetical protein